MSSVPRKTSRRLALMAATSLYAYVGTEAFLRPALRTACRGCWVRGETSRATTKLNGVREWKQGQPGDLREIGLLPFPVDDVMCPGETKALHLYEARFLSLFENAIKNHGGCVGGAIFVDDGVLVRVGQLCDIVAWEREEVGVSVSLRCIGRCEIKEVTAVDPYIRATVCEVWDLVGMDEPDEEGDCNEVLSSDVFSLHRQCVEIEGKMATDAGGNIGWEAGSRAGDQQGSSQYNGFEDVEADEWFGDDIRAAFSPTPGAASERPEEDDLMARFQRGGGELDLSRRESGGSGAAGQAPSAAEEAGGTLGNAVAGGRLADSASSRGDGGGGSIDSFAWYEEADEDDEEEVEDEEEEEVEDDEEEEGEQDGQAKGLGDLLWGHESFESDGFDSSLEEQVEATYDTLKADLSVSLEDDRGGADAVAFGSPFQNSRDRPWGAGDPKTFAGVVAAVAGSRENPYDGQGDATGDGPYLWGCTSPQEEREQLVSFVSLGCFDPSARLQSLMLMSTGDRLRMARDALAERLKVLVAKRALSQLGD